MDRWMMVLACGCLLGGSTTVGCGAPFYCSHLSMHLTVEASALQAGPLGTRYDLVRAGEG